MQFEAERLRLPHKEMGGALAEGRGRAKGVSGGRPREGGWCLVARLALRLDPPSIRKGEHRIRADGRHLPGERAPRLGVVSQHLTGASLDGQLEV